MQDITKEQLLQKISRLPEDVRDTIYAPETFTALDIIAEHHELDEVHLGLLTRLTMKLMAGVVAPNEFVGAIEEDLGIEREKVIRIVQEINHAILNPIKDSLLKVHAHTETSPAMQQITARTIPDIIVPPKATIESPMTRPTPPVPGPTPIMPTIAATTPVQPPKATPVAAVMRDPSPRSVATPPSTLATKLGNTYRVEPTVPHYGLAPQSTRAQVSSAPTPTPGTPIARAPQTPQAAPTQPVPPAPLPQPVRYVPPIVVTEITQPARPVPPQIKPTAPTTEPPPPTQPARYYPPAPQNLPQ